MVKIIGIDPGLADTGIGIVIGEGLRVKEYSYGTVSTSKHALLRDRLAEVVALSRRCSDLCCATGQQVLKVRLFDLGTGDIGLS